MNQQEQMYTLVGEESILVYSHELFLTEKSNLEVTVKQSYYKGNIFYLKEFLIRKFCFLKTHFRLNRDKFFFFDNR